MFYTWAYVVLPACVDGAKYYVNILFCLSVAYNQGMSYRPEVPYKLLPIVIKRRVSIINLIVIFV